MRLVPIFLAVAAALALAAPAAAKELTKAELCGPAGCAAVTDPDELRNFPTGGEAVMAPPPVSSYYTLTLSTKDDVATHSWTIYYVPAADVFAIPDSYGGMSWHPLFGSAIPQMKRLAARVEAFAAPEITSVRVGDRLVRDDAATYLALLDEELGTPPGARAPADWIAIDLRADRPTPWTAADRELMYSPSANVLERRSVRVVLPNALAADIEAGRPLSDDGVRWLPWVVVAVLAGALLLLAGLGAALRRGASAAPSPEPVG